LLVGARLAPDLVRSLWAAVDERSSGTIFLPVLRQLESGFRASLAELDFPFPSLIFGSGVVDPRALTGGAFLT